MQQRNAVAEVEVIGGVDDQKLRLVAEPLREGQHTGLEVDQHVVTTGDQQRVDPVRKR